MKTYTVTFLQGSEIWNDKNLKVVHVKAKDECEAWDKASHKVKGEAWLLSLFEGKHKDLSREIE